MKTKLLLAAAMLVSSSIASALTIGVSDIDVTDNGGNYLTWSTSEGGDFSFDLDGEAIKAYGGFQTSDFPILAFDGGWKTSDLDTDSITSSMFLTPPGSTASSNGTVFAIGQFNVVEDKMIIDFDNTWLNMGAYEVSFLDLVIEGNGSYDLMASFREISAVPEPSTIAMLGLGLIGLGFSRRIQNGQKQA